MSSQMNQVRRALARAEKSLDHSFRKVRDARERVRELEALVENLNDGPEPMREALKEQVEIITKKVDAAWRGLPCWETRSLRRFMGGPTE